MKNPSLLQGLEDSQELYMQSMAELFVANSQGEGDWAPLSRKTQNQRSRQGFLPAQPILIRYGMLLDVLQNRNAPGRLHEVTDNSVRDGYGGSAMHPAYPGRTSNVTIAQVAFWQQVGANSAPAREIMRNPTQDLLNQMTEPIVAGVRRMIDEMIR